MSKKYLEKNVLELAKERIEYVFDEFKKISISFSGGKDSTVLLYLVLEEAKKRNRKVDVLFVDLEGQYKQTIDFLLETFDNRENRKYMNIYWICLPLNLRNAVSVFEPHWCCWDPNEKDKLVREIPKRDYVISDQKFFPFFRYRMEFEEFVVEFAEWLSAGEKMATLVGIRADESLNRFRTIVRSNKRRYKEIPWSTKISDKNDIYNFYPIYDWAVQDIWKYLYDTKKPYNRLYDKMYLAGLKYSEMRICQPYGDDQRKGLDLFHKIEPETWLKIVQRVSGANFGNIYCGQKFLGYRGGYKRPENMSWKEFTKFLLKTMPEVTANHYKQNFSVFIDWWQNEGVQKGLWKGGEIPDESDPKLEKAKKSTFLDENGAMYSKKRFLVQVTFV